MIEAEGPLDMGEVGRLLEYVKAREMLLRELRQRLHQKGISDVMSKKIKR
ncbi:hypothetical protein JXL21_14430 [Candidatus Bathyarchaeota archaeon]|nr:hypothetical protein [Candidatus Bathyarchaeota archaeon]